MTAKTMLRALAFIVGGLSAAGATAYPLDGYEETGIRRLEGNRLADEGVVRDVKQPPGAKLGLKDVDLRLVGQRFDLPAPDPAFTRQITAMLSGGMDSYGLAVLDLSDPARPRYAEHRGSYRQNVGSVGKIVVALALFQAFRSPTTTRCACSIRRRASSCGARSASATRPRCTNTSTGCSRRARTQRPAW
jgi:hypothetical protein